MGRDSSRDRSLARDFQAIAVAVAVEEPAQGPATRTPRPPGGWTSLPREIRESRLARRVRTRVRTRKLTGTNP